MIEFDLIDEELTVRKGCEVVERQKTLFGRRLQLFICIL